jgi:pimeloyl-ACP methyl ester carboxylesterase
VEDMLCILRRLDIGTSHLMGWCSGAGIALLAAQQHPEIFTDLVLVNGEYQLFKKGHKPNGYQRSYDTFLPVVASDRRQASFVFAKRAEITAANQGGTESELDKQIKLPYSKEEYLYRYARTYMAYRDFDALPVAREVRQSTFVLTGRKDIQSSVEHSEAISGSIPGSKTFIDDKGDHYEFCRAGSLTLEEIGSYLAKAA